MQRTFLSRPCPGAVRPVALRPNVRADGALHSLWELHGIAKHRLFARLIHVLRLSDYPLSPVMLDAYRDAKSVLWKGIWKRSARSKVAGRKARQRHPARGQNPARGPRQSALWARRCVAREIRG